MLLSSIASFSRYGAVGQAAGQFVDHFQRGRAFRAGALEEGLAFGQVDQFLPLRGGGTGACGVAGDRLFQRPPRPRGDCPAAATGRGHGEHGDRGQRQVPAAEGVAVMAPLRRRQQVDAQRYAVAAGDVDAGQGLRQRSQRGQLRVEALARHHHQFDVELAVAFAAPSTRASKATASAVNGVCRSISNADHVAQALGRGGRQRQAAAQPGGGGQQQPARQIGQARRQQRREHVMARRRRSASRVRAPAACPGRAVAPPCCRRSCKAVVVQLQQQAAAIEPEHATHAQRQPGGEIASPPRQKAARARRQARAEAPQPVLRPVGSRPALAACIHRGEAPSSQRSGV